MNRITVADILEAFSRYDITYNIPRKMFLIREPMLVDDFVYLRLLVSQLKEKVEIRVDGE